MAQPHPNSSLPPFKLGGTIYDQSTYNGRLCRLSSLIDPRRLLITKRQLQDAVVLIDSYKQGTLAPTVTNEDLWAAQHVKESILHRDTDERIPMPFRMSGFIPSNAPIMIGLLLPNQTIGSTIFWQWLNQSHNACFNYANRNATQPTPTKSLLMGYTGAVTSAVSISVGLTIGLSKMRRFTPEVRALLGRFVAYPAIVSANMCNIFLMRYSSFYTGIDVYDNTGKVVGVSQMAAKQAVATTALTRVFLPAPILLIPPAVMAFLEKRKFLINNPRFRLPIHSLVVLVAFSAALPSAIAYFPQEAKIATSLLEDDLRQNTSEEFLYFNKGL